MEKFHAIPALTKRTFRQNKNQNIMAVIAILLTTLMFTTLFVLTQSMRENMIEMAFRQSGYNAQVSFKNISPEQSALIAAHPDVKEVGNSLVLGVAENSALMGHQVEIRWADNSFASHSFSMPTVGTMPQKADELALDTITLDLLGISHELGQTVTLEWRMDITSGQKTSSTFTLCGYWEGNQSVYASMAWVSRTFADEMTRNIPSDIEGQILGLHMAQVTLYHDNDIESAFYNILTNIGLQELDYDVNLAYSPEINLMAAQENLPMYLGMLLVFIAGYLIIYNIFQISVTTEIQFYGKLKTLGTTKKQIQHFIYGRANLLCIIGIPIGLLLGYLLGTMLVPVLIGNWHGEIIVSAAPIIFIGSAAFAWITTIISCMRPAYLAGKISPIEAQRYDDVGNIWKNSMKKRKDYSSLFSMASANLCRNLKRTVIVICSLTLSLVLLSCLYAKNSAFDMEKYLSELILSDFELTDATHEDYFNGYNPQGNTLSRDLIDSVKALNGLESIGHMYTHQTIWDINDQVLKNLNNYYTKDILTSWSSYDPTGASALQEAIANRKTDVILYGLDGIPLSAITQKPYLLDGTFDAEKFASGEYVLAIGPSIDPDHIEAEKALPTASVRSDISIEGKHYTVMAIVLPLSPITEGSMEWGKGTGFDLRFIIPSETFQRLFPNNTLRKFFFNVEETNLQAAQELLNNYSKTVNSNLPISSRDSIIEQYKSETRSSAVMGNAISVVIALVGVLNFINSMSTSIVSRKKEFAVIQSIGMTKHQLCKMLIYEGFHYAGITLIVSYVISTLAVGIGVRALVDGGYTTFHFTLLPLLICTPILLICCATVPILCLKNVEKQSIVERLRNE